MKWPSTPENRQGNSAGNGDTSLERDIDVGVTFREYAEEPRELWASFVDLCDQCWLPHTPQHIDAGGGNPKWVNASFSIRENHHMIGICVVGKIRDGLGSVLFGPGLAVLKEHRSKRILRLVEDELLRRACRFGVSAIRFWMPPGAPANWRGRFATSYLSDFEFSYGTRGATGDYESGYFVVSGLARGEDEIFKSFTKGNISAIKKCDRLGLVSRKIENASDAEWDEFLSMYNEMCRRRSAVTWGPEWIDFLKKEEICGRVVMYSAYLNGSVCASILLNHYKGATAYYAAGCTDEALSIGAMVHLHYLAMKRSKIDDVKFYILGPVFPILEKTEMGRISAFKSKLGDERWDMLNGERIVNRGKYFYSIFLLRLLKANIFSAPGVKSFARKVILFVNKFRPS